MSSDLTPAVRFNRPERNQSEWREFSLQQFLPADHRARIVWRYVESLDLSSVITRYKAVEGTQGRNPTDPRVLMALWIYATTESISSAREIDRRCKLDLAYMWICGGVSVNHHMISDFRSDNCDLLHKILVTTVASMIHAEVISLETVAQDGMRTRANAGSKSFRRKPSLEQCVASAQAHVQRLKEQEEQDNSKAAQAAQERAAREKLERAEEALRQVSQMEEGKQKEKELKGKNRNGEARCSTTDPDARKMKMGDGGFRPAYNVQLASDVDTRMIVGVAVINSGSDQQQMAPMVNQIRENFGIVPTNYLVDCGYPTVDQVTKVERSGTKVHAPIHGKETMQKKGTDPYARQRRDTNESFAFRQRMSTPEAQELYKQRPSVAEYSNAELRNRGLTQFRVRGLKKVLASTLMYALTFNFMRMLSLNLAI